MQRKDATTRISALAPARLPAAHAALWDALDVQTRQHFLQFPAHWYEVANHMQDVCGPMRDLDTLGYPTRDEYGPRITAGRRWRVRHCKHVVRGDGEGANSHWLEGESRTSAGTACTTRICFIPQYDQALCSDVLRAALEYYLRTECLVLGSPVVYRGSLRITREAMRATGAAGMAGAAGTTGAAEMTDGAEMMPVAAYMVACVPECAEAPSADGLLYATECSVNVRASMGEDYNQCPRVELLSYALQLLYGLAAMQIGIPGISLAYARLTPAHMLQTVRDSRARYPRELYRIVPHNGKPIYLNPRPTVYDSEGAPLPYELPQLTMRVGTVDDPAADDTACMVTPPEKLFYKGGGGDVLRGSELHASTFSAGMNILRKAFGVQEVRANGTTLSAAADAAIVVPKSYMHACTRTPTAQDPRSAGLTDAEARYIWMLVEMLGFPAERESGTPVYAETALYEIIAAHRQAFRFARTDRGWLFPTHPGALDPGDADYQYDAWLKTKAPRLWHEAQTVRHHAGILGVSLRRMLSWTGRDRNRPLNQLLVDARNISHGITGYGYANQFHLPEPQAHAIVQEAEKAGEPISICVLDTKSVRASYRQRGKRPVRTQYTPMRPPAAAVGRNCADSPHLYSDPVVPGTDIVLYYHSQDDVHAADQPSPKLLTAARKLYHHMDRTTQHASAAVNRTRTRAAAPTPVNAAPAAAAANVSARIQPPLRCSTCQRAAHLAVSPMPFCSEACYHSFAESRKPGSHTHETVPLMSLHESPTASPARAPIHRGGSALAGGSTPFDMPRLLGESVDVGTSDHANILS